MLDNKERVVAELEGEVEREEHGYKLLDDNTIKCADCKRKLVDIIRVKDDDNIKKEILATCPCGGCSFIYAVTGQTYIQPADGVAFENVFNDGTVDGVVKMRIKVIKI